MSCVCLAEYPNIGPGKGSEALKQLNNQDDVDDDERADADSCPHLAVPAMPVKTARFGHRFFRFGHTFSLRCFRHRAAYSCLYAVGHPL